jgi:hypothetical protein
VLQADSGVVPLLDIAEVICVRLEGRVILVIDVLRIFLAELALLEAWVWAALLLLLIWWHGEGGGKSVEGD